jgi:hypothetical protein
VVVAEERPRVQLTQQFCKLFQALGLNTRCVSTSFGCRVNPGICVQGASSAESANVRAFKVNQLNFLILIIFSGLCRSPRVAQQSSGAGGKRRAQFVVSG